MESLGLPSDLQQRIALIAADKEIQGLMVGHHNNRLVADVNAWDCWASSLPKVYNSLALLIDTNAVDLIIMDCMYWEKFELKDRICSFKAIISDIVLDYITRDVRLHKSKSDQQLWLQLRLTAMSALFHSARAKRQEMPANAYTAAAHMVCHLKAAIHRDWQRISHPGKRAATDLATGICCSSWLRGRSPSITLSAFSSQWAQTPALWCSG